jgi:hypothetical protein
MLYPSSLKRIAFAAFLIASASLFATTPAFAAGDGGSGGGGGGGGGGGSAGGSDEGMGGGGSSAGGEGGRGSDRNNLRPVAPRPAATMPMPACPRGLIFDARRSGCIPMRRGEIDDETLYRQGARLAVDGRYEDAIAVLTLVERKDDARVLNYLGFSHRKLGSFDTGLAFYRRAIAADPDYTLVREYLGEAYVELGLIELAKEQLKEIENRCGITCETYKDLAEELARAERQG